MFKRLWQVLGLRLWINPHPQIKKRERFLRNLALEARPMKQAPQSGQSKIPPPEA